MSQYSQIAGSFVRTSDYPLEADYIFRTEQDLIDFYNIPTNNVILHKGLFKIVEDDGSGNQALYWVAKNQTSGELEFRKLIALSDLDTISESLNKLQEDLLQEIIDREGQDTALWGTTDPQNIPDDLNSIIDLAEAVQELRDNITDLQDSLQSSLKKIAGTEDEDVWTYLDSLPYNTITKISDTLDKFFNSVDPSNSGINTLVELNNFLEGYDDTQKLRTILTNFKESIIGDPAPSEEFRTFRAIEDFVRLSESNVLHDLRNCHVEIDNVQTGVGLSSDGAYSPDQETYYLKEATSVMNALKTLDSKIKEILSKKELEFQNTSTVTSTVTDSVVQHNVKLSSDFKNQLVVKGQDGLYINVNTEFSEGVLTLKVNDTVVATHDLGLNSLVEDAYYDPTQENIVIQFKGAGLVKINVAQLIREWEISNGDSPIVLTREQVVNGTDKLSATVRLSNNDTNILKIVNGSLLVEGTSNSITHNGVLLYTVLNNLSSDLQNEVTTTQTELTTIKNSINTLKSDVESSVSSLEDEIDTLSSTTNTKIQNLQENLSSEINRALSAESTLSNAIANEAVLRKTGDDNLSTRIDALETKLTTLQQLINTNSTNIATIDSRLLLVQQQIESIIQLQRSHGWYEE